MDANWVAGMYVCISRSFCPLHRMDGLGSSARTSFSMSPHLFLSFFLPLFVFDTTHVQTDKHASWLLSLYQGLIGNKKRRKQENTKHTKEMPICPQASPCCNSHKNGPPQNILFLTPILHKCELTRHSIETKQNKKKLIQTEHTWVYATIALILIASWAGLKVMGHTLGAPSLGDRGQVGLVVLQEWSGPGRCQSWDPGAGNRCAILLCLTLERVCWSR